MNEINAANEKFMEAIRLQDPERVPDIYAEGAILLPPFSDFVKGTAAIQTSLNELFSMGITEIRLNTMEVKGYGDEAREIGTYTVISGVSVIDSGKYLVIWKKEDKVWKMYRDIHNSSVPLPAIPEPADEE